MSEKILIEDRLTSIEQYLSLQDPNNPIVMKMQELVKAEVKNKIDEQGKLINAKLNEADKKLGLTLTKSTTEFQQISEQKIKNFENSSKGILDIQSKQYAEIKTNIESLLPGATAASLAAGFDAKEKSYDQKIQKEENYFIISVSLFVIISAGLLVFIPGDINTFSNLIISLLSKSPFLVPVAFIAFYFSARKSESLRLKEEYSHKKEMAQAYVAYSLEVSKLGATNQALKEQLLKSLLKAIEKNPSELLPIKKEDGWMQTLLKCIFKNKGKDAAAEVD